MALVCHLPASYLAGVAPSSRRPARPPVSPGTDPGRPQQRRRTRAALLSAAARLLAEGKAPSVTEVADAADVSRRTAYRYFPTQDQLLVEAALEGFRPIVTAALDGALPDRGGFVTDAAAAAARLDAAVRVLHRLTLEHEPLLRTMFRLTAGGGRPGSPSRGSRRLEWIAEAIDPVRHRLGKAHFQRLVSALSLCVGADALFALRDMRGLSAAAVEAVTRWSAQALLAASLAEAPDPTRGLSGGRDRRAGRPLHGTGHPEAGS